MTDQERSQKMVKTCAKIEPVVKDSFFKGEKQPELSRVRCRGCCRGCRECKQPVAFALCFGVFATSLYFSLDPFAFAMYVPR
jgi:hypothetical protein